MSNPANVKTLTTPVPVHGKNLDTLVINEKRISINYTVPAGSPAGTIGIASAQVSLTDSESVVNGQIVTPQGQQPGSNVIAKNYTALIHSGEPSEVYAEIFAAVTAQSGYTYVS